MDTEKYHRQLGWKDDPFVKSTALELPIIPHQIVYNQIQEALSGGSRSISVISPIGYGKTTLMNLLMKNPPRGITYVVSFDTYEPADDVMSRITSALPLWKRMFSKPDRSGFGEYLRRKLGDQKIMLLFDEAQDYDDELFRWLRVINDRVLNAHMVFFGLRGLLDKLSAETSFRDRMSHNIELELLPREQLKEIVKARIKWVGGEGARPFTEKGVDALVRNKAPRKILEDGQFIINESARRELLDIGAREVENILGAIPPTKMEEGEEVTPAEKKVYPYSIGDFSDTQQNIIKQLLAHDKMSVKELSEVMESSIEGVRNLIRKLRGLEKDEIERRPNVVYPVVVEVKGGSGRSRYSYKLSDQAKRILGEK